MFKRLYNFLFSGGKKVTNIIEPPGGIDGISINQAVYFAKDGYKIRRLIWAKGTYLTYDNDNDTLSYHEGGLIHKNWSMHMSDYVSCDWRTDGKFK